MYRCIILLLVSVFPACILSQMPVKMMTYNIHAGVGNDTIRDLPRIAGVINGENPDVVAIQETDSLTVRSGKVYQLGELASLTGMKPYFAPAIDFDGGKYGIGILSKEEPIAVKRIALPGREEARVLIVAEYPEYLFCCTHLSLSEPDRIASAIIINGLAEVTDKPIFLAGDLNSTPDDGVIGILSRQFRMLTDRFTPTYPSDNPAETLDYVMVANGQSVTSGASVLNEPEASDHRPVSVNVYLTTKNK